MFLQAQARGSFASILDLSRAGLTKAIFRCFQSHCGLVPQRCWHRYGAGGYAENAELLVLQMVPPSPSLGKPFMSHIILTAH